MQTTECKNLKCQKRRSTMVMSARQIGHRLPILSRCRIHDSQNRWWPHGTSTRRGSSSTASLPDTPHSRPSHWQQSRWRSRRRRQLLLRRQVSRCPNQLVRHTEYRSRLCAPMLWLTAFRNTCTLIMLCFATHTHDVPAFSSPAFSIPGILVPRFPFPRFQSLQNFVRIAPGINA